MFLLRLTSYNEWVEEKLSVLPELSVLSGFSEHDYPGVGTFYDFQKRLRDGPYKPRCPHYSRPSERFKGVGNRFRRNLKGEKEKTKEQTQPLLAEKNEGRVEHEVKEALERMKQALPEDFLHRVEELLYKVAIVPSAKLGMLGDLEKLAVSGDGSPVATQAQSWGKAICNCREEGKTDCNCDRLYADPEATWGWDSHNDSYIFGYRFHVMSIKHKKHELPVHIMLEGAHTPDVLMGIEAISRVVRLMKNHLDASLDAAIFDLGYDATWFYKMLLELEIKPIIPLKSTSVSLDDIPRDEKGCPLCPGGAPFRFHQHDKKKGTLVYYCTAKNRGRDGHVELSRCPNGVLCQPGTKMGPLCHIPVEKNPRLSPPLSRHSEKFKELYKQRTAPERFFSFSKESGKLKYRPYRRKHHFLLAGLFQAIGRHAKAWVQEIFGKEKVKTAEEVFLLLEKYMEANAPKKEVKRPAAVKESAAAAA